MIIELGKGFRQMKTHLFADSFLKYSFVARETFGMNEE